MGEQIAQGLWRWTAYHEEWREDVACHALRRGGDLVLVDPLLAGEEQWAALEAAVDDHLHILLTVHWHARSSAEIISRMPQAHVWAHTRNAAAIRRRTPVTDAFRPGDPLPGGLQAYVARPRTEVVLWDPDARALITGDVLLGDGEGGVRMCPASWLPQSATLEQLRESLRGCTDLPIEMVLVSHGDPVLRDGRAALERALA